jgi:hypothetical protein
MKATPEKEVCAEWRQYIQPSNSLNRLNGPRTGHRDARSSQSPCCSLGDRWVPWTPIVTKATPAALAHGIREFRPPEGNWHGRALRMPAAFAAVGGKDRYSSFPPWYEEAMEKLSTLRRPQFKQIEGS